MENFPPKVENFPPLQNAPIHVILESKNLFGSGKFSSKVEKIPLSLFGMKSAVLVCPEEQKIFLPKWKILHQKWKSCSTPRASLARAVF